MNRFMEWLGLVDENESQRDALHEAGLKGGVTRRSDHRPDVRPTGVGETVAPPATRRSAEVAPSYQRPYSGTGPELSVVVRPGDQAGSMVGYTETIEARGFSDAKKIADFLRERIPVIVNLRGADPAVVRRLVDFTSGLVYALDGSMRKVSEGVLLVSPPRVKILERELRRLSELGLYDYEA